MLLLIQVTSAQNERFPPFPCSIPPSPNSGQWGTCSSGYRCNAPPATRLHAPGAEATMRTSDWKAAYFPTNRCVVVTTISNRPVESLTRVSTTIVVRPRCTGVASARTVP